MNHPGAARQIEHVLQQVEGGRRPADLESVTLDFKRTQPSSEETARDLAEAAACFANSRGGTIIVGVDDRTGGRAAFLGCPHDGRSFGGESGS
jgi:Predicted transcriptional regulator containing an HTH domain and an uncharacterized domain shared with the mammalian protein Schlafen